MNSISNQLFHGREDVLSQTIENKTAKLRFDPEKGLYSKSQGGLRAIGLTSPNEKTRREFTAAYNVVAQCIQESYGPEAETAFRNNFADRQAAQKPLTLAHVEVFLEPYNSHPVIAHRGIILNDSIQAQKIFEGAMKRSAPSDSQVYTSRRTISRAEMGAYVPKHPEEDEEGHYENVRIPKAAVFIHGENVRRSLEEELKAFPNFQEDSTLSKRSTSPELIPSETSSETFSDLSEQDVTQMDNFVEEMALGAIARNGQDWSRFELIIGNKPVMINFSELDKQNPQTAAASLAQLKTALSTLTGRDISNREAFEIIRLIDKDGRTAGFPSGKNQASGIGFGTTPIAGREAAKEKVVIRFNKATGTYDISRTSAPSYLKNIIIPDKITVREKINGEYTDVQRPQVIEFLVAADSNGDPVNIKTETDHPELQRFQTGTAFTYRLTPPASDDTTGSVEIVDSRHYYEPVVRLA